MVDGQVGGATEAADEGWVGGVVVVVGRGCNRFRHQQNILAAPGQAQGGRQGRSCSDPAATTQATHPPPTTRVMCGDNSTVWVGWGWGGGGVAGGQRDVGL